LGDRDRYDACLALEILRPMGLSLVEAAHRLKEIDNRTRRSCTVEHLVDLIIRAKQRLGTSAGDQKLNRIQLNRFQKAFLGRIVADLKEEEIEAWLHSLPVEAGTRLSYLRSLKGFFRFALQKKFAEESPVQHIKLAKPVDKPVEIYTPQETRALITHAGDLSAFIAIAAFAGLRSSEIQRLDWSNICLIRNVIEVPAKKTKTKRRRTVAIQPNLRAILQRIAQPSGNVAPKNQSKLYRALDKVFRKADVEQKDNALRHSYCSYRLPILKSSDALALEMGNSSSMIFQHYRELVTEADVVAYWQIFPEPDAKLLPFPEPKSPLEIEARSKLPLDLVAKAASCG